MIFCNLLLAEEKFFSLSRQPKCIPIPSPYEEGLFRSNSFHEGVSPPDLFAFTQRLLFGS